MAAFLVRAFEYTDPGSVDFVDDDGSIFEADIERLAAAGVTVGCNPPDNTMFCPDQVTTREQMAAFLHRAFGQPEPDLPEPTGWLRVEGNRILLPSGDPFHGRGVNIFDTRDAGACAWTEPNVDEWIRRIDVLIDDWNVTFFRLDLVSFESSHVDGYDFVQWMDVNQDPGYLADVKEIVDHIGTRPGVYVLVTVFSHPSLDDHELPTDATMAVYRTLAETFLDSPQVLYGVTNEPHDTSDVEVWNAMNAAVSTLRGVEPAAGPHHLIAVQGTQEWARRLDYYVTHPITAGGGDGIVYETHVYNPPEDWQGQFIEPAETLPVIIGEYGPDGTYMKTVAVARQLMATAEAHGIPYIGWSFSSQNRPTMLEGDDPSECRQDGWPLVPTEWGQAIIDRLGVPW
jgi:endoglucanase